MQQLQKHITGNMNFDPENLQNDFRAIYEDNI